MKRAIIPFLFFVGFVLLSGLYYWQLVLFNKPMVYGAVSGVLRAILIVSGFAYCWMLVRKLPFLKNARQKIDQYPSSRNQGGFVIAITLGIIHMAGVYFGAERFNQYLLTSCGKVTNAVINNCRQNRHGKYCLYEYTINQQVYRVSTLNKSKKYKEHDTISILYYPDWPAISVIKE